MDGRIPALQESMGLVGVSRRSTLDGLKDKKRDLEHRLAKVEEAISLFEENPNIAKAIDLLGSI